MLSNLKLEGEGRVGLMAQVRASRISGRGESRGPTRGKGWLWILENTDGVGGGGIIRVGGEGKNVEGGWDWCGWGRVFNFKCHITYFIIKASTLLVCYID